MEKPPTDRSWLVTELIGEVMPRPEHFNKCRGCSDSGFLVEKDPYDVISGSPILAPGYYCLNCYNNRVLAALSFIIKNPESVKKLL